MKETGGKWGGEGDGREGGTKETGGKGGGVKETGGKGG